MPRTIYFIPQLKEAVTIILLYLPHVFRILSKTMYFTTQQRTTAFAASFTEERSPFSLDPPLRAVIKGVPVLVLNQLINTWACGNTQLFFERSTRYIQLNTEDKIHWFYILKFSHQSLLCENLFRILLRPIREAKWVSHLKNRFVQSQITV